MNSWFVLKSRARAVEIDALSLQRLGKESCLNAADQFGRARSRYVAPLAEIIAAAIPPWDRQFSMSFGSTAVDMHWCTDVHFALRNVTGFSRA